MIGKVEKIKNKEKADTAADSYYRVVVYSKGSFLNLLLTQSDLNRVAERAEKNEEDCKTPSWWQRFVYWFIR